MASSILGDVQKEYKLIPIFGGGTGFLTTLYW